VDMRASFSTDSPNNQPGTSDRLSIRDVGLLLLVFVAYVGLALYELNLIHSQPAAGVIWVPAGISLAAILLLGRRAAPILFLAAFLVELLSSQPPLVSLAIAGGNTAEALLGGYLVNRFAGGAKAFSRPVDVLRFSLLAGAAATLVSSIVGASVLHGPGGAGRPEILATFAAWWAGHALGVLVLTPFLLLLLNGTHQPLHFSELAEMGALLAGLSIMCVISFGPAGIFTDRVDTPLFLCVPFLVWVGIRFCPLEASGACLVLCGFATWGSVHGYGPFNNMTAMPLSLAVYLCVSTTMTLTGAATVTKQREISEQLLENIYAVEQSKDAEIKRLSTELDFLRDELIRRVHARSRAESAARQAHSSPERSEVLWFLEAETENILYVSPSYETVWGRSREDLRRDAHAWLDAVHPDDRANAFLFVGQDFPGDRAETTYRVQRPDGSLRWIFDRGFVIRDLSGRPTRYLGLASDITDLVLRGEVIPPQLEHRATTPLPEGASVTNTRRKQE
jgi:PAS domain S-box-containing protein